MKLDESMIGKVIIRKSPKKEMAVIDNKQQEVLNYDLVTTPVLLLKYDENHIVLVQQDGNRIILDDRMNDDLWMLYSELDPQFAELMEKELNARLAYSNSVPLNESNVEEVPSDVTPV